MKVEYTFPFLNFLIVVLCNSSANCWSDIFSFVIPPSEADLSCLAKVSDYVSKLNFLSKNLETIEARHF